MAKCVDKISWLILARLNDWLFFNHKPKLTDEEIHQYFELVDKNGETIDYCKAICEHYKKHNSFE